MHICAWLEYTMMFYNNELIGNCVFGIQFGDNDDFNSSNKP